MNWVMAMKLLPLALWLAGIVILIYWLIHEQIGFDQWRLRYLRKRVRRAIRRGRLSDLKRVIKAEPALLHQPCDEFHLTPLELASLHGQALIIYWLRDQGARSNMSRSIEENAIYSVYRRKMSMPLKRALLDAVCWRAGPDELGQALCLAAHEGNVTVVVDLLARGANLNTPNNISRLGLERTPLMLALAYHHDTVARVLVANGADPYWFDGEVKRPMGTGSEIANLIHLLQTHGWQNSFWQSQQNPLVFAIQRCDLELIRELVHLGAIPWMPLVSGATPWLIAKALRDPMILELLRGSPYLPLSLHSPIESYALSPARVKRGQMPEGTFSGRVY